MCARLLSKTPHRSLSYMLRHEFARRCIDAHGASERPARIDPVAAEHPARGGRTTGPVVAESRLRSGRTPYRKMLRGLCVYLPNAVSDRAFHTHTRYLGSISKRVRKPVGMQKPPVSHVRNGGLARF